MVLSSTRIKRVSSPQADAALAKLQREIRALWPKAPSLDFTAIAGGDAKTRLTALRDLLKQGVRFTGEKWTQGNVANVIDGVRRTLKALGVEKLPMPEGLHFRNAGVGSGAVFTDKPPTVNIYLSAYPDYEPRWTEYTVHELGHFVDHSLRDKKKGWLRSAQPEWVEARRTGDAVNRYAASEADEDFADTFRWWVNSRTGEGASMSEADRDHSPSAERLHAMEKDLQQWLKASGARGAG